MKNLLLLILSILIVNGVFAQVEIDLQPIPAEAAYDLDDPNPNINPYDAFAHATITNNSSETKTYVWVKKIISKPEFWTIAVCDKGGCYSSTLDSTDFTLDAGEAAILDVHAYCGGSPTATEGCVLGDAFVKLEVVEVGNEANTITGEYAIAVGQLLDGLTNQEINALQLFPNPTNAIFQLKGDSAIKQVKIYNALGQEMRQEQHFIGKTYDIADLQKGLYFVSLQDKQNQVLKTMRLQKF